MLTKTDVLANPPKQFRTVVARGIDSHNPVDPTGGEYGAGTVVAFAAITRGEALGHGVWVDETFLDQVVSGWSADGIRTRFTHPGMSADGLGRRLGKSRLVGRDGDVVRADLHFSVTSHTTPDGDLAAYVMGMAKEEPALFGASIVFTHDPQAEWDFAIAHGAEEVVDPYYGVYLDFANFRSPDPLNTKNLPHARLAELRAVDIVDEPAANPGGMFHATTIPAEADAVMAYALGLSNDKPSVTLGIDPDRLRGFASRFLSYRKLAVTPLEDEVKLNSETTPEPSAETEVVETPGVETPETPVEETTETVETPAEAARAELSRYVAAFGAENGAKWFAEGKPYIDCQTETIASLRSELSAMGEKVKAALAAAGEPNPLDVTPPDHGVTGNGKSGLSRYADAIKMPSRN